MRTPPRPSAADPRSRPDVRCVRGTVGRPRTPFPGWGVRGGVCCPRCRVRGRGASRSSGLGAAAVRRRCRRSLRLRRPSRADGLPPRPAAAPTLPAAPGADRRPMRPCTGSGSTGTSATSTPSSPTIAACVLSTCPPPNTEPAPPPTRPHPPRRRRPGRRLHSAAPRRTRRAPRGPLALRTRADRTGRQVPARPAGPERLHAPHRGVPADLLEPSTSPPRPPTVGCARAPLPRSRRCAAGSPETPRSLYAFLPSAARVRAAASPPTTSSGCPALAAPRSW